MMTDDGQNDAILSPVIIMTIGDGMALCITSLNDNDHDARH